MSLASWRAALRLARRDALRAKGRSALVITMVAVPILAMAGLDVVQRSSQLTPGVIATRDMGQAAAVVRFGGETPGYAIEQAPGDSGPVVTQHVDGPTAQDRAQAALPKQELLRRALPAGARTVRWPDPAPVRFTDVGGAELATPAREVDLQDPLTHGLVTLGQGHWPDGPRQLAVTRQWLRESGLGLGGSTQAGGVSLRIVAVVENPADLRESLAFARPGDLPAAAFANGPDDAYGGGVGWLVELPGGAPFTWSQVVHANRFGVQVTSRQVLLHPPATSQVPLHRDHGWIADRQPAVTGTEAAMVAMIVGMALLEIVLLVGPAFAVGARRSRRQLGLMAAQGGDRGQIRAVVLSGGMVLGAVGAVAGVVLGLGAVALGWGWLEDRSGHRFDHFTVRPLDLLGIVGVGLVTGLLAALVPAWQTARQPVLASLGGRSGQRPPSKWLTLVGAALAAVGVAVALVGARGQDAATRMLFGCLIAEVGLVLCTPFLVGLVGRLAPLLPLGPRLALRDAARHRGRTAPAVAAVLAAVAGASAVLTTQAGKEAAHRAAYTATVPMGAVRAEADRSGGDAVRAAVERAVAGLGPAAQVSTLQTDATCSSDVPGACGVVYLVMPKERLCPGAPFVHQPEDFTPGVGLYEDGTGSAKARRLLAQDPRCRRARAAYPNSLGVVGGDERTLHNLLGTDDPAALVAWRAGRVLVPDARYVTDGQVTLAVQLPVVDGADPAAAPKVRTVRLPAAVVHARIASVQGLLGPGAVQAAGLAARPSFTLWLPGRVLSGGEEARAIAAASQASHGASVSVERGYQDGGASLAAWILALAACFVAVAAAGAAAGLAAADSQQDLATLAAVGATPRIRRTLTGFQCAAITTTGAVLGILAGLVPEEALRRADAAADWTSWTGDGDLVLPYHPFVLPWGQLALLAVGLPLIAWALPAALTRSRVPLLRR